MEKINSINQTCLKKVRQHFCCYNKGVDCIDTCKAVFMNHYKTKKIFSYDKDLIWWTGQNGSSHKTVRTAQTARTVQTIETVQTARTLETT